MSVEILLMSCTSVWLSRTACMRACILAALRGIALHYIITEGTIDVMMMIIDDCTITDSMHAMQWAFFDEEFEAVVNGRG